MVTRLLCPGDEAALQFQLVHTWWDSARLHALCGAGRVPCEPGGVYCTLSSCHSVFYIAVLYL